MTWTRLRDKYEVGNARGRSEYLAHYSARPRGGEAGIEVEVLKLLPELTLGAEAQWTHLLFSELPDLLSSLGSGSTVHGARIPRILDRGLDADGSPCLIRECCRGTSLSALIGSGTLSLHGALAIIESLAITVVDAHQRGLSQLDLQSDAICVVDPTGPARHAVILNLEAAFLRSRHGPAEAHTSHDISALGELLEQLWTSSEARAASRNTRAGELARRLAKAMQAAEGGARQDDRTLLGELAELRQVLGPIELVQQLEFTRFSTLFNAYHAGKQTSGRLRRFADSDTDEAYGELLLAALRVLRDLPPERALPIVDCGRLPDGQVYSFWHHEEGEVALAKLLGGTPRSDLGIILSVAEAVFSCLSEVHHRGLILGLVAPELLLVKTTDRGARVRLLDTATVQPADTAQLAMRLQAWARRLPQSVAAHIAPEARASGSTVSATSDTFGAAVILLQLLLGTPLDTEIEPALARLAGGGTGHPEEGTPIWSRLCALVARALAADPGSRLGSHELCDELGWLRTVHCLSAPQPELIPGYQRGKVLAVSHTSAALLMRAAVHTSHLVILDRRRGHLILPPGMEQGMRQLAFARVDQKGELPGGIGFTVYASGDGVPLSVWLSSSPIALHGEELVRSALPPAEALAWMHSQGTVHRGLAGPTLVISDSTPGMRRLAVVFPGSESLPHGSAQTWGQLAPEQQIGGSNLSDRTDVYNFGAALLLMSGVEPSPIGAKRLDSPALAKLLSSTVHPQPNARPPMNEVVLRLRKLCQRPTRTVSWQVPVGLGLVAPLLAGAYLLYWRTATRTVEILSTPDGASVYNPEGELLGRTPLQKKASRALLSSGQTEWTVQLVGYARRSVTPTLDQDRYQVRLPCITWDLRSTTPGARITLVDHEGNRQHELGTTPLRIDCAWLSSLGLGGDLSVQVAQDGCPMQQQKVSPYRSEHLNFSLSCTTTAPSRPAVVAVAKKRPLRGTGGSGKLIADPLLHPPASDRAEDGAITAKVHDLWRKQNLDPLDPTPMRTVFNAYVPTIVKQELHRASCQVLTFVHSYSSSGFEHFDPAVTGAVKFYVAQLNTLCPQSEIEPLELARYNDACASGCRQKLRALQKELD